MLSCFPFSRDLSHYMLWREGPASWQHLNVWLQSHPLPWWSPRWMEGPGPRLSGARAGSSQDLLPLPRSGQWEKTPGGAGQPAASCPSRIQNANITRHVLVERGQNLSSQFWVWIPLLTLPKWLAPSQFTSLGPTYLVWNRGQIIICPWGCRVVSGKWDSDVKRSTPCLAHSRCSVSESCDYAFSYPLFGQ